MKNAIVSPWMRRSPELDAASNAIERALCCMPTVYRKGSDLYLTERMRYLAWLALEAVRHVTPQSLSVSIPESSE